MPSNKNHHFVPRVHLKPFSLAGEGVAINLFNLNARRSIPGASLKGQCARHYFYGKDLNNERALSQMEGVYGAIVRRLIDDPGSLTADEVLVLRDFTYLQFSRTEIAAQRLRTMKAGMASRARLTGAREDLGDEAITKNLLSGYKWTAEYIDDLKMVLIVNEAGRDLITSDNPAVMTNRWHLQRLNEDSFGLVSAGCIFSMPLSPRLSALFYDGDAYTIPEKRGLLLQLSDDQDVDALNELQLLNCGSNIYFQEWDNSDWLANEFERVEDQRLKEQNRHWAGVLMNETRTHWHYRRATADEISSGVSTIVTAAPIFPSPSRWISYLHYRPDARAMNNGAQVGYVREAQGRKMGLSREDRVRIPRRATGAKRSNADTLIWSKRAFDPAWAPGA